MVWSLKQEKPQRLRHREHFNDLETTWLCKDAELRGLGLTLSNDGKFFEYYLEA